MGTCKTLVRTSFFVLECGLGTTRCSLSPVSSSLFFSSLLSHTHARLRVASRRCFTSAQVAASIEPIGYIDEALHANSIIEPPEDQSKDTVEHLLNNKDDVTKLMKMKRKPLHFESHRWFPYLDSFKSGNGHLKSSEILEALDPYIMDERKERFRNVVKNRSYSVCLVVEGLSDFGNVSAAFRSADALGFQSVHVIACDSFKRCINFEVKRACFDFKFLP
ncbi:hypothetical protein L6164_006761 [Bauhinia variegata]|uniref:Uncharacterized protein n=1 Tax=Bauhinia variegata TaxID=167791 RepID=A0ACB9PVH3_BAUVA|nr:hypothetical protein L6164_006761 [Bauhinia variegata]